MPGLGQRLGIKMCWMWNMRWKGSKILDLPDPLLTVILMHLLTCNLSIWKLVPWRRGGETNPTKNPIKKPPRVSFQMTAVRIILCFQNFFLMGYTFYLYTVTAILQKQKSPIVCLLAETVMLQRLNLQLKSLAALLPSSSCNIATLNVTELNVHYYKGLS